jgi:hypothetical protein
MGSELVKLAKPNRKNESWKYTQNWIAFEIGIACEKEIDVWAISDGVPINFPMPYLNNYFPADPNLDEKYPGDDKAFQVPYNDDANNTHGIKCRNCGAEFNLHKHIGEMVCPQCLKSTMYRLI